MAAFYEAIDFCRNMAKSRERLQDAFYISTHKGTGLAECFTPSLQLTGKIVGLHGSAECLNENMAALESCNVNFDASLAIYALHELEYSEQRESMQRLRHITRSMLIFIDYVLKGVSVSQAENAVQSNAERQAVRRHGGLDKWLSRHACFGRGDMHRLVKDAGWKYSFSRPLSGERGIVIAWDH